MAKQRSIVFKMDGKDVVTDANGVAVSVITVVSTVKNKDGSVKEKVKTPVECPHFRPDDINIANGDAGCEVVLPEGWDMDKFLKALNQGTRLLAQQPVHAQYAPQGETIKHRTEAMVFIMSNPTNSDCVAVASKIASGKFSMKEINALYDEFYAEFMAEQE